MIVPGLSAIIVAEGATSDRTPQLEAIIKLRNRIAHHEPLGAAVEIRRRVSDILAIGTSISPEMAAWWRGRTSIWHALDCRPRQWL